MFAAALYAVLYKYSSVGCTWFFTLPASGCTSCAEFEGSLLYKDPYVALKSTVDSTGT